jgi:hypothetical protein
MAVLQISPSQSNYQVPIGANIGANSPYIQNYNQQAAQQPNGGSGNVSGGMPNLPSGGPFSGITNGIDKIGGGLGFAGPNMAPVLDASGALTGTAGSTLPGVSSAGTGIMGSGTTLSGALGAAGIGAFAGSFLGKIGGNPVGGSIGGGLGAGIGMAAFGPIGGIIGGLIGGIGGGFFGGAKPSNKWQSGGFNLSTGEIDPNWAKIHSASGKKFDDGNAKLRDSVLGDTSTYAKALIAAGATPKSPNQLFTVTAGSRDGLWYRYAQDGKYLNSTKVNTGKDPEKFRTEAISGVRSAYNATPEQIAAADRALEQSRAQAQGLAAPIPNVGNRLTFDEIMRRTGRGPVTNPTPSPTQ